MTEYCINWDSYKTNICSGFSRLQQNQEFVDMTLAAGGHMVKVHQNIIALASPYLKGLIQSAKCQHPIIFLSGISHEVLCFILEYVYAGEIRLPIDKINMFFKAARALCIVGIQDMGSDIKVSTKKVKHMNRPHQELQPVTNSYNKVLASSMVSDCSNNNTHARRLDEMPNNYSQDAEIGCIDDDNELNQIFNVDDDGQNMTEQTNKTHVNLYSPYFEKTENLQNINENPNYHVLDEQPLDGNSTEATNEPHAFSIQVNPNPDFIPVSQNPQNPDSLDKSQQYSITVNSNPEFVAENQTVDTSNQSEEKTENTNKLSKYLGNLARYSLSNRGALQLIVNRYVYYCHHQSEGGRKRRWRCMDYRRIRCKAYVDSVGEAMTHRKFGHLHPFHDIQILKKMDKGVLFDTIAEAQDKIEQLKHGTTEDVIRCKNDDASDVDME